MDKILEGVKLSKKVKKLPYENLKYASDAEWILTKLFLLAILPVSIYTFVTCVFFEDLAFGAVMFYCFIILVVAGIAIRLGSSKDGDQYKYSTRHKGYLAGKKATREEFVRDFWNEMIGRLFKENGDQMFKSSFFKSINGRVLVFEYYVDGKFFDQYRYVEVLKLFFHAKKNTLEISWYEGFPGELIRHVLIKNWANIRTLVSGIKDLPEDYNEMHDFMLNVEKLTG